MNECAHLWTTTCQYEEIACWGPPHLHEDTTCTGCDKLLDTTCFA